MPMSMPSAPHRAMNAPGEPNVVQARALWAYNEDGRVRCHVSVFDSRFLRLDRSQMTYPSLLATSLKLLKRKIQVSSFWVVVVHHH